MILSAFVFAASSLFALPDSSAQSRYDRIEYRQGTITVGNKLATLNLGDQFKYVGEADAEFILTSVWGNPPGNSSLGMIFPKDGSPLDSAGWAIVIQYSDDGYVKDDDAKNADYDDVLKKMQKAMREENADRKKQGYQPIELVGWAEKPFYDAAEKKIFWAKDLKFGDSPAHTLNYNIRILGKSGYLVMNVVSDMAHLPTVKEDMQSIIRLVEFTPGNRYADFRKGIDKVAKYGIVGLVAGGLLAKAGFFKLLIVGILAMKKFLILLVVGIIAALKRFAFGKNKEQKDPSEFDVKKKIES